MQSQIHTVARHYRNLAKLTANMLLPTKTALELGARCRRTYDDIHFSVPSLHLREIFPRMATDPDNAVKLMPGTALDGGPNLIEQFTLCALVKKIQPKTILEIGTFREEQRGISTTTRRQIPSSTPLTCQTARSQET